MQIASTTYEFFKSLIDYAGLFPPAVLPLAEALQNYRTYLEDERSWVLAAFIIPAGRLVEIAPAELDLFSAEYPLKLSVLSSDPGTDIQAIASFLKAHSDRAQLMAVETKSAVGDTVSEVFDQYQAVLEWGNCTVFCEFVDDTSLSGFNEKVAALVEYKADSPVAIGVKLRCGGVVPEAFPAPEVVAECIIACATGSVPLKFTAGLHHPFRHFNEQLDCRMHGYFNLFFAGSLASTGRCSQSELVEVISAEDSSGVVVTDEKICWLGHEVSLEEIANGRKSGVLSYGSCSFTEPIEDARVLGWL